MATGQCEYFESNGKTDEIRIISPDSRVNIINCGNCLRWVDKHCPLIEKIIKGDKYEHAG